MKRTFDFSTFVILAYTPSEFARGLLTDMCRALHFKSVISARDFDGAWGAFTNNPVDIVVGDVALEDGSRFLKNVRNVASSPNPHVPFIATSLSCSPSCITRARDCGATEFLGFPLSASKLIQRIIYTIEHPRVFVNAANYKGPDRRRRCVPLIGEERRTQGSGAAADGVASESIEHDQNRKLTA